MGSQRVDQKAVVNELRIISRLLVEAGASVEGIAAGAGGGEIIMAADIKTSGTNGGTFTSGAWRTRDLTTLLRDDNGSVVLSSNQLTLPAGKYFVQALGVGLAVGIHKLRLRDVTNSVDLVIGLNSYSIPSPTNDYDSAELSGVFTLADVADIELQHRCSTTVATNGFGSAQGGSFGVDEVYATLLLRRTE